MWMDLPFGGAPLNPLKAGTQEDVHHRDLVKLWNVVEFSQLWEELSRAELLKVAPEDGVG